jgi:uncharacterized protein DUF3987
MRKEGKAYSAAEDMLREYEAVTGTNGSSGARYAVTPLHQFSKNETPPTLPVDAFPAPACRLVEESAKAIGCPPDAIGLAALVALGSAIGNSRVLQAKKNWSESATIFGAVVAEPGEKKTAAVKAATNPARKLENKLQRKHEVAMDEHAQDLREYEVEKRDAAKAGETPGPPPRAPEASRVRVNDTTVEALIPILKENPRGLLLERDELAGWVKGMDQYKAGGKGSERQFWLSVWSNEPTSVDRKGQQGPVSVPKPFTGVIGSIQPDVLGDLAENREDGMLERFLFAYPRMLNALWTEDDVSEGALVGYRDLYNSLRNLNMQRDEDGDPIEVAVVFSPEAKEVYVEVYNRHRKEMAAPGFPRYLRGVWAKLEAYTLRITLILACCRFVEQGVAERAEVEDVLKAVALIDYFKAQARRVFGTLYGFDEKKRLLEDVSAFVGKEGGVWIGTATELHQQFHSTHKPESADVLSRFIKEAAEDEEGFSYASEMERYKDEEGEWKSKRVLTLLYRKTA